MSVTIYEGGIPQSVEDVRNAYHPRVPLLWISPEIAEASKAILEQAGYVPRVKSIDVAIHSEDKYPQVATVVDHVEGASKIMSREGTIVGPCYLNYGPDGSTAESLVAKGIAIWFKSEQPQ